MKIKKSKPELNKDSDIATLSNAVMHACRLGFLDASKNLKEKIGKDIVKAIVAKCMARHEKALIEAYKSGYTQAKQQKGK